MLFKSKGIILRSTKYSETSLILDVFTEENGLNAFIISGVRKSRSKTSAGILRPINIIDLIAYNKSNESLSRIKEVKLNVQYDQIPFDVIRSSIGLFMIDISRNAIREKGQNKKLYTFLHEWLCFLDNSKKRLSNLHLLFMLELAIQLGFEIQNNYSKVNIYFNLEAGTFNSLYNDIYSLDDKSSEKLHYLINCNKENVETLPLTSDQRNILLDALINFYSYHIHGFGTIKSLEVFRTVLS